ncbi:glutathione S-transferase N-terminal domain-containing protein [Baekduia sp.]|jgi:glutathione S-transferase|uniref:glutathione S-transferase N-terminal domain-containing protein n=1 Tax=Baekduia sp. TaxID=2600305 RepID=UPI002DFF7F9C|nr:glutathione S-transferase N-terminal domain-containing protein [Baekduia sp.]
MSEQPRITVHLLPPSHPCATVEAALKVKGLEYERVELKAGAHIEEMQRLYGEGRHTVPGAMFDDEPVHGSIAILERLEQLVPEPALYPSDLGDAVPAAERWGDDVLQDLGRRLPWGALHFRPESMGTMVAGGSALDPAGTDFAMRFVRGAWKYHNITAVRLAEDLAALPAMLDRIDAYVAEGILAGEAPNAADLQIGATLSVLLTVGDLRPLIEGRPAEQVARKWFDDRPGLVPAGAFPTGWVPSA